MNDYTSIGTVSGTGYAADDYRGELTITQSPLYWSVPEQKKEENMRSLFRITVVNPKTEEVYPAEMVVAKDRENALLKADLIEEIRENPDAFDIIVEIMGDVRAKKEVGRVKVITED